MLRGIEMPVLVRFADILKHRLSEIHTAFQTAIAENGYQGAYAACIRSRSTSSATWSKKSWNSARVPVRPRSGLQAGIVAVMA